MFQSKAKSQEEMKKEMKGESKELRVQLPTDPWGWALNSAGLAGSLGRSKVKAGKEKGKAPDEFALDAFWD